MHDSTEFHEVYNATGEVLQNVQPITGTYDLLNLTLSFGVLLVFLIAKKMKKRRFSY